MAETAHTATPWSVEHGHEMSDGGRYWQIHDGQDAICCNQFCYAPNTEANAAFIATSRMLLPTSLRYLKTVIEGIVEQIKDYENAEIQPNRCIINALIALCDQWDAKP